MSMYTHRCWDYDAYNWNRCVAPYGNLAKVDPTLVAWMCEQLSIPWYSEGCEYSSGLKAYCLDDALWKQICTQCKEDYAHGAFKSFVNDEIFNYLLNYVQNEAQKGGNGMKHFTLKDKKIIKNRWKTEFADNGWMDWICPDCGTVVWNDDVHVYLDWVYCPYCGNKIIEYEATK